MTARGARRLPSLIVVGVTRGPSRPGNADTTRDAGPHERTTTARTTGRRLIRDLSLSQSLREQWPRERPMKRAVKLARTIGNAVLVTIRIRRVVQIDSDENLVRELVRGGAPDPFPHRFEDLCAPGLP